MIVYVQDGFMITVFNIRVSHSLCLQCSYTQLVSLAELLVTEQSRIIDFIVWPFLKQLSVQLPTGFCSQALF